MKRINVGILAHVDAGKTTLSEALLYRAGAIRTLGRVDHQDAFLDSDALERRRGITIFSKQARLTAGGTAVTLLDTPGHVDFSAEMERTLEVLDYAILVISGTDGVQAHTETLWALLRRYGIPTFLFVTKLDLPGPGPEVLLRQLRERLGEDCVDVNDLAEEAALRDEGLLERFLETDTAADAEIASLIQARRLFPCYFGSGLRLEGVDALLDGLDRLTLPAEPLPGFGAKVYKILRDGQGSRMTCLRVTGGTLPVRTSLTYQDRDGEWKTEKVTQLRRYSGDKFETIQEAVPGEICTALGLSATWPGQGLGAEEAAPKPLLRPVMTYGLRLPPDCDRLPALQKLRQLEEEDPSLHLCWDDRLGEIQLQLMGEIQIEVLKSVIASRFSLDVEIGEGRILYLETIEAPVEGVGHYEPLRHYAEVHLLLEPLPRGAGLQFETACPEDVLDRSWQKLILTHLQERTHRGVLTGAPITDMKITLAAGRAHLKHTEGGDFRQATYRAVRQGLMQARSVLLEPMFSFRLQVPLLQTGRAIQDLKARGAEFGAPETEGEASVLTGTVPVEAIRGYPREVAAYTRGLGALSCRFSGYAPCRTAEAVIAAADYDPERDLEHTPDSVFCAHGAGFSVKWNEVPNYMHLDSCLKKPAAEPPKLRTQNIRLEEKELQAILDREFGPIRRPQYRAPVSAAAPQRAAAAPRKTCWIVDGYNVIFAWEGLRELADSDLDGARQQLMDILCNYRAFTGCDLVLVFDAYRVRGGLGEKSDHRGIRVVFTKENETGDQYLERLVHEIGKNEAVRVVTSDALIQLSALGAGVLRMSAAEFRTEVDRVDHLIAEAIREKPYGI